MSPERKWSTSNSRQNWRGIQNSAVKDDCLLIIFNSLTKRDSIAELREIQKTRIALNWSVSQNRSEQMKRTGQKRSSTNWPLLWIQMGNPSEKSDAATTFNNFTRCFSEINFRWWWYSNQFMNRSERINQPNREQGENSQNRENETDNKFMNKSLII